MRNKGIRGINDEVIKKSKNCIYGCIRRKRFRNFGGQGKPSPIRTIKESSNVKNQKEEERNEPRTKESDNDYFHRKRKDETR